MPRYEPWTPERASEIIAQHQHQKGATLPILHALQAEFGCVPLDAEPLIAEALNVTKELVNRGYSDEDICKIWGGNLLRLWRRVEGVAD